MPTVASDALRTADTYELLSLNPERILDPARSDSGYYHHEVIGRTAVASPQTRARLYNALQTGARWNIPLPAMCFNPRHGIRVTSGGHTTDLIICFECGQVQVWKDGVFAAGFITGMSPASVFDAVLRDAGVALPPPPN